MKRIAILSVILIMLVAVSYAVPVKTLDLNDVSKGEGFQYSDTRKIANQPSWSEKLGFVLKGCSLVEKLGEDVVLDCPRGLELKNARPERIFHITDMGSNVQISADSVWQKKDESGSPILGDDVVVAILDTGIDYNHPELKSSYDYGYDFVNDDKDPFDDVGHGTHVAGILASDGTVDGYSQGVASNVKIIMGKVCGENGCYESDIIQGIKWAVDPNGDGDNTDHADIISMSLGGGNFDGYCDDDNLADWVNWAVDQGVTVIVSSGNDGAGVSSPACASGAIAVGAVDSNDEVTSWSNYGDALSVVAPGVDIYSPYPCSEVSVRESQQSGCGRDPCACVWYATMSGTSMSAPHVSGEAALLLQNQPGLSPSEVKEAIEQGADRDSWDEYYGWGRINAYDTVFYSFGCTDGENESRQCGESDIGICEYGYQTRICDNGVWSDWGTCEGAVYPSMETCDGLDNDCDGMTDEDFDLDGDGFYNSSACEEGKDCNDNDATINPNASEICDDGIDNDCDGSVDCDDGDCSDDLICDTSSCGDGVCEGNGEDCFSCPDDCACVGRNCERGCCGDGEEQDMDSKKCEVY